VLGWNGRSEDVCRKAGKVCAYRTGPSEIALGARDPPGSAWLGARRNGREEAGGKGVAIVIIIFIARQ
jgi:hypothetical protein